MTTQSDAAASSEAPKGKAAPGKQSKQEKDAKPVPKMEGCL